MRKSQLSISKESKFINSVNLFSTALGFSKKPIIKIWDGVCPESPGGEIAHMHPERRMICISRGRLDSMNFDEIEHIASHEVAHLLSEGHDIGFLKTQEEAKQMAWMLQYNIGHIIESSNIVFSKTKPRKNGCSYNMCNKKSKLAKCNYCSNKFCELHKRPKTATTMGELNTESEPIRTLLEKDWRSEDGHPDFIYNVMARKHIVSKDEISNKEFLHALDRLKDQPIRYETPISNYLFPKVKKSYRNKERYVSVNWSTIIFLIFLILVMILLFMK